MYNICQIGNICIYKKCKSTFDLYWVIIKSELFILDIPSIQIQTDVNLS